MTVAKAGKQQMKLESTSPLTARVSYLPSYRAEDGEVRRGAVVLTVDDTSIPMGDGEQAHTLARRIAECIIICQKMDSAP